MSLPFLRSGSPRCPVGPRRVPDGGAAARAAYEEPPPTAAPWPGPVEEVFAGLARAFIAAGEALVMVATISNACPST